MNQNLSLFKKEILEQYRTKKIFVMAILFLFVGVASPLIAKMIPELMKSFDMESQGIIFKLPKPTFNDALDQFMKNISQIALLGVIFVNANLVTEEKNKKTLELLLTKPLSRTSFIFNKFIVAFLSLASFYLFGALIFMLYSHSIFGSFDFLRFLLVASSVLVYLILIVSATVFASTLFESNILAIIFGLASSVIFGSIISMNHRLAPYAPGYILDKYKFLFNRGFSHDFVPPLVTSLILIFAFIILAILIFRRHEVER